MALNPGDILVGRYRIEKRIAEGGMGAVYAAQDLTLEIRCAIKENSLHSETARRQFEREARLLATLRHRGLPNVTDYFAVPDQGQYLVMTFIEGEDLAQRMSRLGRLPEADVQRWGLEVLEALAYLHQRNIIHRDIKPANIKITPAGSAVLVDFGIAKELNAVDLSTTTGARRLTPGFAPPEQYGVRTSRTDGRSDVYALGATLYALLTGIMPADALSRLMDPEIYVALSLPELDLNPAMAEVIDRALLLDPKLRFASAQEMLIDFQRAVVDSAEGQASDAADPLITRVLTKEVAAPRQPAADVPASRRWMGWAAIAALLLVLLLIGWWGRAGTVASGATPTAGVTSTVGAAATGTAGGGEATSAAGNGGPASATPSPTLAASPGTPATSRTPATPTEAAGASHTPGATLAGASGTQTASASAGQSQTSTASVSAASSSASPTRSATATATGSLQATPTHSASASPTSTASRTATHTATQITPTATSTRTATASATASPTPTPTIKPSISLGPSNAGTVVGGSTGLVVSISAPQPSDVVIGLSSSSGAVSVPGSVVIAGGATSAQFSAVGQSAGSAAITASLPASLGGASSQVTVTVNKADTSLNVSASPNPATAGQQVTVSFNLSVLAPGSGSPGGTVTLTQNGAVICTASPPSGSCNIVASPVGTITLSGSYSGDSNFNATNASSVALTVSPLQIALAPPDSCTTGNSIQLTASINAAQAGDTTVSLASSSNTVSVPPSVTIPAGATSAMFTANGLLVGQSTITATLPAALGGGTATAHVRFALPIVGC